MRRRFSLTACLGFALMLCSAALAQSAEPAKSVEPIKPTNPPVAKKAEKGWVRLFDGKTLKGWKVTENPKSFRVEDGVIVVNGPRGHLFYDGPVGKHDFRNFELKLDVKTEPHANSGVYFHTLLQPKGWPERGFEVQVNQTHSDPKKTGGLYNVKDVTTAPAKDKVWFNMHIVVRGKRIVILVDGKKVVDFTETKDYKPPQGNPLRKLAHGTIALQAHDPGSTVRYKNIQIRLLPNK